MQSKMPYILKFHSPRDGVLSTTHIDAEDDPDAMDQALERINRRTAEGLEGDHVLIGPGGRKLKLDLVGCAPAD